MPDKLQLLFCGRVQHLTIHNDRALGRLGSGLGLLSRSSDGPALHCPDPDRRPGCSACIKQAFGYVSNLCPR
jgi:hypothetical protein